jgi:hypothetical protein
LGAIFFLLLFCTPLFAGSPHSAYYSTDTDKLFWFIQTSDVHVGASGTQDSQNLQWIVSQARTVINPSFIVVTGDLTDSTNGNIFGYPNGPYQAEWTQYATILSSNGVNASFYYDIPGNHDAYNDRDFAYYVNNSIQGRATGKTQVSWTRAFPYGTYHFLGVNTADNTGAKFSLTWPYGDNAGLDPTELGYISNELSSNSSAILTLVFGHHPLAPTGNSSDTYLYYGKDQFVSLMNTTGTSLYGYGHTHAFSEQLYTQNMSDGIFYFNVASLGKSSASQYTIMAVDCNGISAKVQTVGTWPAVLITAPMDRRLGGVVNPYAYTVPPEATNPLRALVFDSGTVSQVRYRIDGSATWYAMSKVATNSPLWKATWNGSGLAAGEHTIEVQATGSTTKSDSITVYVQAAQTPPAVPANLTAAGVSSSQISLAWTDNSNNETGFKIERCLGATCSNFAQIATVGANVASYSDTGLSASTSYSYRVRASNSAGDSDYSNTTSATTQAASSLPAAPSGLTATASATQINLTWTDNSTNETGFSIERCKGTTCTNFAQIASVSMNVTTFSNTGLSKRTTYRYRVRAYNAAGNSAYSNIALATTPR